MDADDLLTFETVARVGGITRAGDELHTVQSNVTNRVRKLESELGVPLFHRHSRGVTLTSAGLQLLPYAARVRHLLGEARRAVLDDAEPCGPLIVGTLESTAGRRLPQILVKYGTRYPRVDLTVQTGTEQELVEGVLARRLDCALAVGPVSHPLMVEECIGQEELVLITSPGWGDPDVRLQDIEDLKILVLRRGCAYRQRLEELLRRRGVVNIRCMEFGTLDAILGCAAAGIGVTLLPRSVAERERPDGSVALHDLAPDEAFVQSVFIRRADSFASSSLKRFLDCVREHAEETGWLTRGVVIRAA